MQVKIAFNHVGGGCLCSRRIFTWQESRQILNFECPEVGFMGGGVAFWRVKAAGYLCKYETPNLELAYVEESF